MLEIHLLEVMISLKALLGKNSLNPRNLSGRPTLAHAGDSKPLALGIISKKTSAAKTVGLNIPNEAPAPVDAFWTAPPSPIQQFVFLWLEIIYHILRSNLPSLHSTQAAGD